MEIVAPQQRLAALRQVKCPDQEGPGKCPYPVEDEICPVTPSYDLLQQKGVLWSCPVWEKSNGGAYYGSCTPGSGPNPLCNFDAGLIEIRLLLPRRRLLRTSTVQLDNWCVQGV